MSDARETAKLVKSKQRVADHGDSLHARLDG